jgi:hypothetical protein
MADRKDDWRWKREQEDEREREEETLALKKPSGQGLPTSGIGSEKLDEMLTRADTLIDQLNNLYNMFISGVEKLPPVERRKQLDQTILSIQMTNKPTASLSFKSNGVLSKYSTHAERWDKLIRDLENGKIKRVTKPNSASFKKTA